MDFRGKNGSFKFIYKYVQPNNSTFLPLFRRVGFPKIKKHEKADFPFKLINKVTLGFQFHGLIRKMFLVIQEWHGLEKKLFSYESTYADHEILLRQFYFHIKILCFFSSPYHFIISAKNKIQQRLQLEHGSEVKWGSDRRKDQVIGKFHFH